MVNWASAVDWGKEILLILPTIVLLLPWYSVFDEMSVKRLGVLELMWKSVILRMHISCSTKCPEKCDILERHNEGLKEGRSTHAPLIQMVMNVTPIIGSALIDMYSRLGLLPGVEFLQNMPIDNLSCQSSLGLVY
ncbi:hypothetical protein L1987_43667 [Smallanthus sonchifolius]|uniref:Uncharacterized protein n=1 Tax=Smallanthus sonchifolius TaxID=185202 RepID=A0ACB9GMY5_9ASTR|nr:hypothetical protein L1987_43667 [Smallanthus sonchifolius]